MEIRRDGMNQVWLNEDFSPKMESSDWPWDCCTWSIAVPLPQIKELEPESPETERLFL